MRSLMLTHKGYSGYALQSDADECWHGQILSTTDLITYESEFYAGIKASFVRAVEDYIETLKEK